MPPPSPPPPEAVREAASRITDDADILEEYVSNGTQNWEGGHVLVLGSQDGSDSEALLVGLRFPDLDVPRGVRVLAAHVALRVEEEYSDACNLSIGVELTDDSQPFPRYIHSLHDPRHTVATRSRSASRVTWFDGNSTSRSIGTTLGSPNIADLVQEVVNRPGWTAGNHLTLLITGTGRRAFDGAFGAAPELAVYYLPPTSHTLVMSRLVEPSSVAEEAISNGKAVGSSEQLDVGSAVVFSQTTQKYVDETLLVGLRFGQIDVPRGAVVLEAYLTLHLQHDSAEHFQADSPEHGREQNTFCRVQINAQKHADAPLWSGTDHDLAYRTTTAATAFWELPAELNFW